MSDLLDRIDSAFFLSRDLIAKQPRHKRRIYEDQLNDIVDNWIQLCDKIDPPMEDETEEEEEDEDSE